MKRPPTRIAFCAAPLLAAAYKVLAATPASQVEPGNKQACPTKADTVVVCSRDKCLYMGQVGHRIGGGGDVIAGDRTVVIWRNFETLDPSAVTRLGISTGRAFLQKQGNKYELLCDVDLSLTDKQLAARFGVNRP